MVITTPLISTTVIHIKALTAKPIEDGRCVGANQETVEEEPCFPSWQSWESTKRKIQKVGNIQRPDFLNPDCGLALSGEMSAKEKRLFGSLGAGSGGGCRSHDWTI